MYNTCKSYYSKYCVWVLYESLFYIEINYNDESSKVI